VDFIALSRRNWDTAHVENDNTITAECTGHSIVLAGNDPMGRVSSGHIKLLCHVRPAHDRVTKHGHFNNMEYEQFDRGYDINWQRDVRGSWYCVLAHVDQKLHKLFASDPTQTNARGRIVGLILEVVQESPRIFKRIGAFTHPWIAEGSESMVEYPEFANVVNPLALERKEITII
jgi:hypothetical protein